MRRSPVRKPAFYPFLQPPTPFLFSPSIAVRKCPHFGNSDEPKAEEPSEIA
jgi:hypothetical protein